MTPRQFTSFRARLDAASGLQSAEFRELEAIVGPPLFASFVAYLRRRAMRSTRTTCSRRCSTRTARRRACADRRTSRRSRRRVAGVALSPSQDGRAHHRRQTRHRWFERYGVPQVDAVQAGIPRPVGDPEPAVTVTLDELRATPNALASHYTRFGVADRLLLTGHSHQAWPDVAEAGLLRVFADAADACDDKWDRAEAMAERVRMGYRRLLVDPDGEIALGPNTHDLIVKLLSTLDLRSGRVWSPPTASSTRCVVSSRASPKTGSTSCASRRAGRDPGTAFGGRDRRPHGARRVSAVLFTTARIVPDLDVVAAACQRHDIELLVDAYHALGVLPFPIHESASSARGSPAAATSTSSSARATRSCAFRLTPLTCGPRSRGGSRSSTNCSTRTSPRRSTTAVPPLASQRDLRPVQSLPRRGRPRLLRRTQPHAHVPARAAHSTRSASCDRPSTRSAFPTCS